MQEKKANGYYLLLKSRTSFHSLIDQFKNFIKLRLSSHEYSYVTK